MRTGQQEARSSLHDATEYRTARNKGHRFDSIEFVLSDHGHRYHALLLCADCGAILTMRRGENSDAAEAWERDGDRHTALLQSCIERVNAHQKRRERMQREIARLEN
jgi:hypothetical protein